MVDSRVKALYCFYYKGFLGVAMMENVNIRDARRTDLEGIIDIYNSTIASRMVTADLQPVTPEERESWFNKHTPEFRPLWVAEFEERLCGWVSFESFYGRPAYNQTAEVSIYIHHDFRGKGLGTYLLNSVIDACPRLNVHNLVGFIFGHNTPSLKLFSQLGFSTWGHLPKVAVLEGIERDLIIVGKRVY